MISLLKILAMGVSCFMKEDHLLNIKRKMTFSNEEVVPTPD